MHRFVVWVLIVLLGVMAVGHLVLTILYVLGVNEQGHGFFLDYHWPAWLITALDVTAAYALWQSTRGTGDDRGVAGPIATFLVAIYLIGRMAWTVVVPVLAGIAFLGALRQRRSRPHGASASRS